MNDSHSKQLNTEIRRLETRDLARRDIKSEENTDKLQDFMKIRQIKNIKIDKLVDQKKQGGAT